jgi:hypothetical protein
MWKSKPHTQHNRKFTMTAKDISLIIRKILVGIVITAVPGVILLGGLWITQHTLQSEQSIAAPVAGKGK